MKFLFFWRNSTSEPEKTAQQPKLANGGTSAPVPKKNNRILRGVLDEPEPSRPVAKTRDGEVEQVPLSRKLSVGARLDITKERAIGAATRLIEHADTETAQVIASVVEQLRKQACRIAFVGQVKAGKSSLVNALVEQPDLLPVDINPCTAVITRLSFGVPDRPRAGAQFTFFSRDEWRRLSMGGRTRELTDRLFPDFDWDVLKSQVKEMEERARNRLGASFENLLGTQHIYPEIVPNLLVRYVGTDFSQPETMAAQAEGEFSDITKCADIFLELGAFSFPTVVIDTPGVNDPFLVRDEITRQNLEAADICVVVVTAWQRVSATDLNLLRMLRGLKKDRLIVFVNKVDEVKGGEAVAREIGRQVSETLEQEFPSSRIPVVLGSAAFAHKALNRGASDLFPDHGQGAGAKGGSEDGAGGVAQAEDACLDWLRLDEIGDGGEADSHFEKSGLLPLAEAISELMSAGTIAGTVNAASSLIENAGRNLIAWREIEADLLRQIGSDSARTQKDLAAIAELRKQLSAKFDAFASSLDMLEARKVDVIAKKLASAVQAFIPETLAPLSSGEATAHASQIDVKLRVRLELAFQQAMEDVGNSLENEQDLLRQELSKVLRASGLSGPMIVLGQPLALTPSLAALSEPAALGFTAHLKELSGRPAAEQDRATKLPDLITADFAPIIGRLTGEASRGFRDAANTFAKQTKALTFGPMDSMIERVSLALKEAQFRPPEENESAIQAIRETISNLKPIVEMGRATDAAPPYALPA